MTIRLEEIGKADKETKKLPEEAQRLWVDTYNQDFAWRCQEAHAQKAAWRAVRMAGWQKGEEAWTKA